MDSARINTNSAASTGVDRRSFLAASAGALAACAQPPVEPPPNILFAIADDQSWPHAGVLGDPQVRTPAFDRVAREGALLTHSFAACPSCTPSRSAILTGRHIWQIGEAGLLYGTLPKQYPLFTQTLEQRGYRLGWTGKGWGPGDWQAGGLERYPLGEEFNQKLLAEPAPAGIDQRDYAANFDAFLAERDASGDPDKPFFFWFGCTEPHRVYGDGLGRRAGKDPAQVKVPAYWPDHPKVRNDVLDYYFEIEWFDAHLARMLAELERRGELDRTLVVVTSDNGMPFPRAKVNLYDPGVRMPLAIRWPEKIEAGRVVDEFVSHVDFAATFCAAAGAEPSESFTGRSLLGLLTDTRRPDDRSADDLGRDCVYAGLERHTWCRPEGATYPIRSIRTKEFLYLRNFEPDRWPTGGPEFISSNKTPHGDVDGCPTKDVMIAPENQGRDAEAYRLSFGKRPAEELYRLASDPDQVDNLADDPELADVKADLSARLDDYLVETGDPRLEGRDPWQQAVYHQTIGYGAIFNRSLSEAERREAAERAAHKPE